MLTIIAVLIGLVLGQHVKITVSPELTALADDSLTQARTKVIPAAATKIKLVAAKIKALPKPTEALSGKD